MSYTPIIPAVIPASQEEVIAYAKQLAFSDEFHLDIVDGQFVPTVSWPYRPNGDPMTVKSYLDTYTLEVDLMVDNPMQAADAWIKAGADMLVFHVETIDLSAFRSYAERVDVSIGVSAHGATTLDKLIEYIPHADYVQLMGIREIGAQGQPFDEAVFDKINELKKLFPDISITVDGSVNKDTIKRLHAGGADRFICGSAIVSQPNPEAAWVALKALING